MSRVPSLLSFSLLVLGAVLIADAVRRGDAVVYLIVFVPVLSGSSGEFLLGGLLAFAGIVGGLIRLAGFELTPEIDRPSDARGSAGGIVLIGPLPIFFGSWRSNGRPSYWRWVAVGAVGVVLALAIVVALRGFG